MKALVAAFVAILVALPVAAQSAAADKVLVNAKDGVALAGFDPVSYFTSPEPARGSESITAVHHGATYRFATAANRDLFRSAPERYLPQFGGYCGYGASRGYLAPVDPLAYTIMDGRLILQNSKRVLEKWNEDAAGRLKTADENWPAIFAREAKPPR